MKLAAKQSFIRKTEISSINVDEHFRDAIAEHLSYWRSSAYAIAQNGEDGSDLLQQALLKLLDKMRRGETPDDVRKYVTAIMRNTNATLHRSPAAKQQFLEDLPETMLASDIDLSATDLTAEAETTRRALASLPQDQRDVLISVTVEGRKPRELVQVFGRPAPAISNLLARAKQALYRAVLVDYLSQGGQSCRANAQQLNPGVRVEISKHSHSERGMAHIETCEACQRNWRRFAALASVLGVTPLLIITQAVNQPLNETPETPQTVTESRANTSAQGFHVASVAQRLLQRVIPSTVALVVGLTVSVAASAWLVWQLMPQSSVVVPTTTGGQTASDPANQTLSTTVTEEAQLNVSLQSNDDDQLEKITLQLDLPGDAQKSTWSLDEFEMRLTGGAEITSVPRGLLCTTVDQSTSCEATSEANFDASLVFGVAQNNAGGELTLRLIARNEGGKVLGEATGSW